MPPTNKLTINFQFGNTQPYNQNFSLATVPFNTGTWTFDYQSDGTATVSCENVTSFAAVDCVEFDAPGALALADLAKGAKFPPAPKWSIACGGRGKFHVSGTAALKINFSSEGGVVCSSRSPKQLAKTNAPFLTSHTPNDVVFYFAHSNRELFANSSALKAASPHFVAMFDSGFAEGEVTAQAPKAEEDAGYGDDGDDSDEETDEVAFEGVDERSQSTLPAGLKQVTVTYAAYTTYRALLSWINSGYIEFATLTPPPASFLPTKSASGLSTPELIELNPPTFAPLAPSPKSIYKLAHYLEISELEELALHNLKSQLTPDNVLYQLTTDIAIHDVVRSAMVAFASANWAKVRKTRSMEQLQKREVLDALGDPLSAAAWMFALAGKCETMAS